MSARAWARPSVARRQSKEDREQHKSAEDETAQARTREEIAHASIGRVYVRSEFELASAASKDLIWESELAKAAVASANALEAEVRETAKVTIQEVQAIADEKTSAALEAAVQALSVRRK